MFSSIKVDSGEGITCCKEELQTNEKLMHPACKPIIVEGDPFYEKFRDGPHCLNFVRNSPAPRPGCTLGPREQLNTLTHWLDGSMIYGSTEMRALRLREKRGGLFN